MTRNVSEIFKCTKLQERFLIAAAADEDDVIKIVEAFNQEFDEQRDPQWLVRWYKRRGIFIGISPPELFKMLVKKVFLIRKPFCR